MTDSQVLLVAGGVSAVLCLVLVAFYVKSKRLLDEMWAVDTYSAKELRQLCGPDLSPTVEIEGVVSCDKPLIAPASETPCCYYHTVVRRQTEKTVRVCRDGKWVDEVRTEWNTIFDHRDYAVFKVEDKTGTTMVNPMGADMDTMNICDRTTYTCEPWFAGSGFIFDTGPFQITEEAFIADGYAFVLGQASPAGDEVLIHSPSEGYLDPKKRFFVISRKTERELARSKQVAATLCFWFSIAAGLSAAYCLFTALRG